MLFGGEVMRKIASGTVALGSLIGLVGTMGAACSSATPEPKGPSAAVEAAPAQLSCARARPGVGAVRADEKRQGGAVTLARLGDRTLAYVADEDSQALHTIDVLAGREVATTSLAGSPAQAMVLADGRVVVTLKDKNAIQVLEPGENATDTLTSRCTLAVPAEPFGLATTLDDATLLVTSGWDHALVALDAASMAKKFQVDLPREPRAVIVDDSGERAFVSHVVDGRVSVVDLATEKHAVRDISLAAKGESPFVGRSTAGNDKWRTGSHGYTLAKVTPIDKSPPQASVGERPRSPDKLPPPKPAAKPPTPKARVLVPMVTVNPGDPGVRSTAYYGDMVQGVSRVAPMVSVIDQQAERSMTKSVLSLGDRPSRQCVLPRAAAVRESKGTLYVACLGIDALVEMDARGVDPARLELRRFQVPAGPTGVAIDERNGLAVVWSQFDPGVTIVKLDADAPVPVSVAVRYTPSASVKQLAEGRKIFHHTDDSRIASDGVACATCHPDGREDALTWATPDGPRQTIMLAGRQTSSAPYGWAGKHDNLPDYVADTFRRLGGTGVSGHDLDMLLTYVQGVAGPAGPAAPQEADHAALLAHGKQLFEQEQQGCATCHLGGTGVQGHDLDMLLTYVQGVAGPPAQATSEDPERAALVAHGKQLFEQEQQGCTTCHLGGRGVDKTLHDVGSTASADNANKYDTPSLRFIKGTAPYFHDGRYETLEDMLKASDHRMGHVLQLDQKDIHALGVYLETL
jgi:cytochrome c peroxidase